MGSADDKAARAARRQAQARAARQDAEQAAREAKLRRALKAEGAATKVPPALGKIQRKIEQAKRRDENKRGGRKSGGK